MKIIQDKITIEELKRMAQSKFGDLVKAVVDINSGIMVVDGELHADEEELLIKNGSKAENLWGINLYPEKEKGERIEFDSIINLKPAQGNRTREIDHIDIKEKITEIVNNLIKA